MKNKIKKQLNREEYVPFYLINIANKYTRSASRKYLQLFGIGIVEWRMLSIVTIERYVTANDICSIIHMDKGAASRSIKSLEKRGLVRLYEDSLDSRKRLIALTPEGVKIHNKILDIAMLREKRLLNGFSHEEQEQLISLLKRVNDNLVLLDSPDQSG